MADAVLDQSADRTFAGTGPDDAVLDGMNIQGFRIAVEALGDEYTGTADEADFRHLRKIERVGRLFSLVGFATAWIIPNPLSAFCIQMGVSTRFLLLHVIGHGGYDDIPGIPSRYTSRRFAFGWRRYVDCLEWWPADTWHRQHNELHHYHTGEDTDPDTMERHGGPIARLRAPRFVKHILVFLFSATWKFTAYGPNAVSLRDQETRRWLPAGRVRFLDARHLLQFGNRRIRTLWLKCYMPYIAVHFVAIPLLFLPLGSTAVLFVLLNRLMAEVMANIHGAMVIFPSHAGDDLYASRFHYRNKDEFYATQVIGTANYRTGTEFIDYMSMWLNYQVEHHLFPRLTMLQYRSIQPRVEAICRRYRIPYVQESIVTRARRAVGVITGARPLRELRLRDDPMANRNNLD
jgi:fatty acid desaturase